MKKLLFSILIGLAFVITSTAAFSTNPIVVEDPEIPVEITLKSAYGDVLFPHQAHHEMELTCQTCHHTLTTPTEKPSQTCHECHTADSDISSQKAFHNNCRDCHRTTKKENRKTKAPTSCRQCHAK